MKHGDALNKYGGGKQDKNDNAKEEAIKEVRP